MGMGRIQCTGSESFGDIRLPNYQDQMRESPSLRCGTCVSQNASSSGPTQHHRTCCPFPGGKGGGRLLEDVFREVGEGGGRGVGGFEIGVVVVVEGEGDDSGANPTPPKR